MRSDGEEPRRDGQDRQYGDGCQPISVHLVVKVNTVGSIAITAIGATAVVGARAKVNVDATETSLPSAR